MKKYFKIIFPSVLFLISACSSNKDEIIDIIKPINLIAGKPDSILIGDMFYSNNYDIDFFENKNVRVVYNNETGMIYFFPDENFSGITLVDFDFNGTTYSIPVRSRIQERYKFSFKPGKEYKVLNLFGSFNGWDRGNLPMKDDNNDGLFEAEIALEPGRYQYKFFGDGEEIIDPENKEKVPNGMGDFNSVFTVEEETKSRVFLHIIKYEKTADKSEFNFYYENDLYENPLQKENVIALVDNKKAKDGEVEVSGRSIKLMLNNNELKSKQLLRIAVTVNGTASNIQSVFLADGEPAEQNGKFLWNDAVIYSLIIHL